jgi:2'-5' RNA ligase
MRLFVAVEIPDHAKERLEEVVAELRACRADVRWIPTASMHVTLKFLGNVEPREVAAIDGASRRVAADAAPITARLRTLGSFPHLRRPRVVWAGVDAGNESLHELQEALDRSLSALGFAREKRRFHAHVTIGRVNSQRGVVELAAAIEGRAGLDLGPVDIEALTLFESKLQRSGAEHTPLGVYPLGG